MSSAPPAGPEEEFTDERLDQGLPGRRLPRPAPAGPGRRDPDHRHGQQQRHDPHATPVQGVRGKPPGHRAEMGGARRERPAPAPDHRHRHPGRTVRPAHHRHVRSRALGRQGLAGADERAARRLRPGRPVALGARRSLRQGHAVRPAVLRRSLDHLLPQGPVPAGRAADARATDLDPARRVRRQAQPPGPGPVRYLPARQGRLGREHGVDRHPGQRLRRTLVRRAMAARIQRRRMEEGSRLLCLHPQAVRPARRLQQRIQREPGAVQQRQVRDLGGRQRRRFVRHRQEPEQGRRRHRLRLRPREVTDKGASWLYSWALAIPASSRAKDAAKAFATWATSQAYGKLVADRKA